MSLSLMAAATAASVLLTGCQTASDTHGTAVPAGAEESTAAETTTPAPRTSAFGEISAQMDINVPVSRPAVAHDGRTVWVPTADWIESVDIPTLGEQGGANVYPKPEATQIALAPDSPNLFFEDRSGAIGVADSSTRKVTKTVPSGIGNDIAGEFVMSRNGSTAYLLGSSDSDVVSVVDVAGSLPTKSVRTNTYARGRNAIALSPDGGTVYYLAQTKAHLDPEIAVFDTKASTLTRTIPLPETSPAAGPTALDLSPDGKRLYVTGTDPEAAAGAPQTMSVVDTATGKITADVRVGVDPVDVSVTPDGRYVGVVSRHDGVISLIDTRTNRVVATAAQPNAEPIYIAMSPDSEFAYVATKSSQKLLQISLRRS
ncbi:YncE family protein [Gordonia sp. PP30]|uniref:YncE family protein n=1 Tax=Gordonia sp. PP30 TaxID=2935861 RepID=UPI0020004150|nr:YncE family protein [Gordonia sp. PP30]UQE73809.1 YncE family protein [Gordonia sp. PP30]